jgi:hypothetical protein
MTIFQLSGKISDISELPMAIQMFKKVFDVVTLFENLLTIFMIVLQLLKTFTVVM